MVILTVRAACFIPERTVGNVNADSYPVYEISTDRVWMRFPLWRLTMPRNEIKAFAIEEGANVVSQQDWEASEARKTGFRKGLARSTEINKAIRQSSRIAAAVAGFTAEKSGLDVLDTGDVSLFKDQFEDALKTVSSLSIAEADGKADSLEVVFDPAIRELVHGKLVHVRAKEKNLSAVPTLKADSQVAKTIVKGNNLPLQEGDIAGAGHWLELQYDGQLDKWVLQNPAKGISPLSGVPVGTVEYFASSVPPAGYLVANGAALGRETYPELFAAIGTTFGGGDGTTSFNLPDLIDRFAQGSTQPGRVVEAGVPNIFGNITNLMAGSGWQSSGAITAEAKDSSTTYGGTTSPALYLRVDASRFNPIYGASDTVQPPALTLLPCIKAFEVATNPGLIDITELANDVSGKLDKSVNGVNVKYITGTYNDGTNWYRKWSDGWVEQGGIVTSNLNGIANLLVAFSGDYFVIANQRPCSNLDTRAVVTCAPNDSSTFKLDALSINTVSARQKLECNFYACGQEVK